MKYKVGRNGFSIRRLLFLLSVLFVTMGSSVIGVRFSAFLFSPYRALLIITLMSCVLIKRIYIHKKILTFYIYWIFLILYAGFSIIWIKDIGEWLTCMIYLVTGFAILFSWITFSDTYSSFEAIKSIIAAWLMGIIAIGWYEVLTGHYLFLRNPNMLKRVSYVQNRVPIAFFTNTNNYCLYVVFSFLLLVPYVLGKNRLKKVYYICCILTGFPLLVISRSRATMLGLFIGVFVWWLFRGTGRPTRSRVAFIGVSATGILFVVFYFGNKFLSYFISSGYSSFSESRSNMGRINLIRNALRMIVQTFGFGIGAGNSRVASNHIYYTFGIVDIHNWWLLICCEFGIVFGLVYCFIYAGQVVDMIKLLRHSENKDALVLTSFISIDTAFIICLISPSSVISFEWLWLYWGVKFSWLNSYYCRLGTPDVENYGG